MIYVCISGCVAQYFSHSEAPEGVSDEESNKKLLGYKCVLGSKATEESMVCTMYTNSDYNNVKYTYTHTTSYLFSFTI